MRYGWMLLGLCAVLAAGAWGQTVVINGKTVPMTALVQHGKLLVDAAALAKALGATVTWDPKTKRLAITAGGPAASAVQLPGDTAEFNITYKIGAASPLHFNLARAEYTVSRVRFGDSWVAPAAGEKLLVLHYSVLNPQPVETNVDWTCFNFTVVDASDQNHEFVRQVALEGNRNTLDQYLKPAQRVEAYTVIKVPARGVIPKLIVEPTDGKVLRYDLRGRVKPLAAPFADPADPSGASARAEVPAAANTAYPLAAFDVQLMGAAYTAQALGADAPAAGSRFLVATLRLTNALPVAAPLSGSALAFSLRTAAGQTVPWNQVLLLAKAAEPLAAVLQPDEAVDVRVFFDVPADDPAATLRLTEQPDSRAYVFRVGAGG